MNPTLKPFRSAAPCAWARVFSPAGMLRSAARRGRLAALAACAAAFLAPAAHADVWSGGDWSQGSLVEVQIRVDGAPAPLYRAPDRDDRRYVEAIAGGHYVIVVRNLTGERVGVLLSVDGLNVVSGDRSALSPNEAMYVLGPHERASIRGWRTSLDEVRRFVFVDERRSYAERTGQANGDMGWIRVLAFRECAPVAIRPFRYRGAAGFRDTPSDLPLVGDQPREGANSAPLDKAEPRSEARAQAAPEEAKSGGMAFRDDGGSFPGTGWGEARRDHVRLVDFRPEGRATDQLIVRYEYAPGLVALGVLPDDDRLRDREQGALDFARPPRW